MMDRICKLLGFKRSSFKTADRKIILDQGNTVPTDGTAGYAVGALFLHRDGGEGTALYVNEGTEASCDFNAVSALTATQEALLGAVAGTVTASKAVIVDANKDIGDFRNLDVVNLDAGASGTAGTVEVFAGTASKGKFKLVCQDQDGDTIVTLQPAAMGQASVVSIPDPGAATANVLLTDAANDGVVVTATAAELNQLDGNILADLAAGAGFAETGTICEHSVKKVGGLFKTEILIDLTGLTISASAGDIIGDEGASGCTIAQITSAVNGDIKAGRITCCETPAGGDTDIDFYSGDEGTGALSAEDAAASGLTNAAQLINHGAWTAGEVDELSALPGADQFLYAVGQAGGDTEYTAGIFLIELWGTSA